MVGGRVWKEGGMGEWRGEEEIKKGRKRGRRREGKREEERERKRKLIPLPPLTEHCRREKEWLESKQA